MWLIWSSKDHIVFVTSPINGINHTTMNDYVFYDYSHSYHNHESHIQLLRFNFKI
jgi:hypothetical protein